MDGQEGTETRRRRVVIDASEPEARPWGGRSGEALGAGFIRRSVEIRDRADWLQGATLKWVMPRSGANKAKSSNGHQKRPPHQGGGCSLALGGKKRRGKGTSQISTV